MNSTWMSWKTAVVSAGFVFFALLAACGGGADQPVDQAWTVGSGNAPNAPDAGDGSGTEATGDCTYIQFCDEPNTPRGTICKAKTGCASRAVIEAQCDDDVRAVCGSPVYPRYVDYY